MTVYADYTYYTTEFFGTALAADGFSELAARASEQIDLYTFDRANAVYLAGLNLTTIERIRKATCAVAEVLAEIELNGSDQGLIKSERVGQHSVEYAEGGSSDTATIESTIKTYLATTGLMYRGWS